MVAFSLPGNLPVYTYALMLGFGAAIGLAGVAWPSPAKDAMRRVNAGWWTLLGALILGRITFVMRPRIRISRFAFLPRVN